MILQETYELEDCDNYDSLTSNSNKWEIPINTIVSYSNDGMKITSNSWQDLFFNSLITKPVCIELTATDFYGSREYPPLLVYWYDSNKSRKFHMTYNTNYSVIFSEYGVSQSVSVDLTTPTMFKFEITSSEMKLYVNDILKSTKTYDMSSPFYFGVSIGVNRNVVWKDLKIKSL